MAKEEQGRAIDEGTQRESEREREKERKRSDGMECPWFASFVDAFPGKRGRLEIMIYDGLIFSFSLAWLSEVLLMICSLRNWNSRQREQSHDLARDSCPHATLTSCSDRAKVR